MSELIVELASGHGGNLDLAKRMIDAAAEAGAHTVKTQAYLPESVNPKDPQAEWLKQSALTREDHKQLKAHANERGVGYFASAFDYKSLAMINHMCERFKIASTEAHRDWWWKASYRHERACVSWPWGASRDIWMKSALTAIPLYPTPLDAVRQSKILDGWSDHCVGLAGCLYALAHGAKILEVHLTIPGARQMPWDKTPEQIKELRKWMEDFETVNTGVSEQFRTRWIR